MRIKTEKFYVLLTLFLFTGIALKIYLNERPFEPRERDYALVGSFYVLPYGSVLEYMPMKVQKYLAPKVAGPIIVASILAALCLWHPKTGMTTTVPESIPQQQWPKHTLIPAPQCHSIHNRRQRHVSTMVRARNRTRQDRY
jgi:hypothetical protein